MWVSPPCEWWSSFSLSGKVKASIMDRGIYTIVTNCKADPMSEPLTSARMNKSHWWNTKVWGLYLYNFTVATITAVLVWKVDAFERDRSGDALPGVVHPKVVPRYTEEFRESWMKWNFDEAVRSCLRTEGADLRVIMSIKEQRVFVQDITSRRRKTKVKAADDKIDWDFKSMLFVCEVAASGVRNKLKEVQQLWKDGKEAVRSLTAEVAELSQNVLKTKRVNENLSECKNDLKRERRTDGLSSSYPTSTWRWL